MRVKFNNTDEFIDELRADADMIEPKVLRRTTRMLRSGELPLVTYTTIATAVVFERLVILEHRCGETMFKLDEEIKGRLDADYAKLEAAAKELGLEVRAGVFDE